MRFFIRKRRGAPAVIIVALIDVLIVLLIFLMVTTTFKQQPALKLALPESSQAVKSGANDNPPLILSIDKEGNMRLGNDNLPLTLDSLRGELTRRVNDDPDLRLAIMADKAAPFGQIVHVMDVTKEAKVKMVNAFTKEAAKP